MTRQADDAFPGFAQTPLCREIWDLWADGNGSPALNMAVDEALLCQAPRRGRPLLRCYGWDRPAISFGYFQSYAAAERPGFALVRRPTGGGIVFHDHDFTYTVVVPAGHWLCATDRVASYGQINAAVAHGLRKAAIAADLADQTIGSEVDRRRMVCFSHPTRYDIVTAAGKVAGSAQRRTDAGILHQGSIHFGGPLPVDRAVLQEALVAGFRQCLVRRFEPFQPDPALVGLARDLGETRYATAAWNHRSPK